jgi:hypothetical protein
MLGWSAGWLVASCAANVGAGTGPDAHVADGGDAEGRDGASPQDVREEDGRYMSGAALCCAAGEGRACCGGRAPGTCFQYGGTTATCAPEGATIDAHDVCATCCAGLTRIGTEAHDPGFGGCHAALPPGAFLCTRCGDGACGVGENACNCPTDCP